MGLNLLSCLKSIFPVCGSVKEEDRLSSLPDDVIYEILSLIRIKEAIRMSVLSSRWRYIWTSTPYLTVRRFYFLQFNKHAPTLELLALTTLHLDHVTFWNVNTFWSVNTNDKCIDIFSKCVNLKNLTLNCCVVRGSMGCFRISHPCLSNLTIREYEGKLFTDNHSLQFSTDTLHSLEKLDLCIVLTDGVAASKVFGLLQHLHGVKFLQLNVELVEFLSSSMKVISPPPSKFTQLKSLKISFFGQQRPLSTEFKNYFLGSSPNASFTFFPRT